jgi:hypothetical protein
MNLWGDAARRSDAPRGVADSGAGVAGTEQINQNTDQYEDAIDSDHH